MKKLIPIFFLAVSFAFIEGSVVKYLRVYFNQNAGVEKIYSLHVIQQPKTKLDLDIIVTEIWRELATLILLITMAWIAANSIKEWLAYFIFGFAVWDIFYYIWLTVLIDWPESLFDWDILFLVPKAWYAPVIVPCIISLIGIVFSLLTLKALKINNKIRIKLFYWLPFIVSIILWQVSFLNKSSIQMTIFPKTYSWWLFIIGVVLSISALIYMYRNLILHPVNNKNVHT